MRRLCPVCLRQVTPTKKRNVIQHVDGRGAACPFGGESYELAIVDSRRAR